MLTDIHCAHELLKKLYFLFAYKRAIEKMDYSDVHCQSGLFSVKHNGYRGFTSSFNSVQFSHLLDHNPINIDQKYVLHIFSSVWVNWDNTKVLRGNIDEDK